MKWFNKIEAKDRNKSTQASTAKALLVSDFLSEKSIGFFSLEATKEDILFKLVSFLPVPAHNLALDAVLEREKMGGTIVDSMISVPHARLKGLKTIELAAGIRSGAPVDQPRLFFLFLSPREDTKIHLLFLSSLSSLFQSEGFVDELSNLKTPCEVVAKIRQIEKGV